HPPTIKPGFICPMDRSRQRAMQKWRRGRRISRCKAWLGSTAMTPRKLATNRPADAASTPLGGTADPHGPACFDRYDLPFGKASARDRGTSVRLAWRATARLGPANANVRGNALNP